MYFTRTLSTKVYLVCFHGVITKLKKRCWIFSYSLAFYGRENFATVILILLNKHFFVN
jgi:hypothetical protein